MKKHLKLFYYLFLFVFCTLIINVNASTVPYDWIVGGEEVNMRSNSANTATLVKDGKIVTLKLNNYNGKGLELNCYGTGQPGMTFIIELSGNNVITDDSIGIDFYYPDGKIEFKGDGNLKIYAKRPISYESIDTAMIIIPSENKYEKLDSSTNTNNNTNTSNNNASTSNNNTNTSNDNTNVTTNNDSDTTGNNSVTTANDNKETTTISKQNNINNIIQYVFYALFGVYFIISTILFVIIFVKLSKK